MANRPDTDQPTEERATATVSERPSGRAGHVTEPARDSPQTVEDLVLPLRFEAKRVIGRGGMGVVVEALDRSLGRDVAVKVLAADKRDPVHRVRFRREAKAAAVLRHPNVVTVYDVDTERDFIVMELVRGESLRARLKREGALPAAKVRRIGVALLDALAAAHDAKIIHRDVKPANILFDEAGVVKLVDFGIASFGDRDLTSTGMRIGTPAYMAPEQLRGRVADVRADLYAVGATLFEAATGVQLHDAERSPMDVTTAVAEATGDTALADAITRAVSQLPEDRFPSARAFAAAIGAAPRAGTAAERARSGTPARTRRRWPLAIAAIVVAGGAAAAVFALRDRGERAAVGPVTDARRELRAIAMLPFVDDTHEPRLDFTTSGLPHILATALKSIPELEVVSYYELLDRLPGPSAPMADWRAAASSLGADVVVRGELLAEPAGIRITVAIESIGGVARERFERVTTVDGVPEVTRAIAGDVARAIGRVPRAAGESRQFDVEANLLRGIDALERQDFHAADELLQKVELSAPDVAEAQYYRAVLNWWLSRGVEEHITRALAGNLDAAQRGFMEGLRLVQNQSHEGPAIDHFKKLAERFPDHRDIQYGLFEALYHGGYPAEAMVVYRRLGDRHPRFRLGLKHALAYTIGHANEDGMRWVIARLHASQPDGVLWQARAHVARRDYAAAIALLRRHEGTDQAARRELTAVYLLDGQLGLAKDLAAEWPEADVLHNAAGVLGLALARGASGDSIREFSDRAAYAAALATGEDLRDRGWMEVAAVELPAADRDRLRRILKGLDSGAINRALARVLVAGALREHAIVDGARTSEFPEVVAIADAYRAEWAKDWKRAAAAWASAIERASDGTYLIVEHLGAARVALATSDHEGVLAACAEVIRPRRFTWAWGGAVGPCLRWSAEAATALGRTAEARAHWERLLALRTNAPPHDDLVRAARAGLAGNDASPQPRFDVVK